MIIPDSSTIAIHPNRPPAMSSTSFELCIIISLREEDKLAIIDEDERPNKEPQIICSLGITN